MNFERWNNRTVAVDMVRRMLATPEIWDPQASDGKDKADIEFLDFDFAWVATIEGAYVIFDARGGGLYEQHTGISSDLRGVEADKFVRAAAAALFEQTDATEIITRIPDWHRAAHVFAARNGMRKYFHQTLYAVRGGEMFGSDSMGLTMMEWAYLHHLDYAERGEKWHEQVFSHTEPTHAEDPAHNGFLGLALAVGMRQPLKGITIYNAWAARASYAQAKILHWQADLCIIDIGDSVVVQSSEQILSVTRKQKCQQ